MELSRQDVVNILRRTGFPEVAEEAARELPDPVDSDRALAWGQQHGVTRDQMISQMGGSP